jgi:hypothetical protein
MIFVMIFVKGSVTFIIIDSFAFRNLIQMNYSEPPTVVITVIIKFPVV